MPIRPENRARYPKNWKSEIVPRVRRRSRNRCECTGQCGLQHGRRAGTRCKAKNGQAHPTTGAKVVLTVMHLNHQPEDNRPENLLHGCQQCHNRYDAPMRRTGVRQRARDALGMEDLLRGLTDAPPG